MYYLLIGRLSVVDAALSSLPCHLIDKHWQWVTTLDVSRNHIQYVIFYSYHQHLCTYRSRQCYESKVLHNTKVTWFSTFRHSPKNIFLSKLPKKVIAPFITLLLAPSKPKLLDCTVHNQCLDFLENCDFS